MNADQFLNQVKSIIAVIADTARLIACLIFSLLLLGTLASMAGHPIPYIPAIRADMQQLGIVTAAMAYALWKK